MHSTIFIIYFAFTITLSISLIFFKHSAQFQTYSNTFISNSSTFIQMWFEQLVSTCSNSFVHVNFTLITTILYTIWTTQSLFFLLINTFYQFIMFCFTYFWNVPCQTCDKDAFFCPACLFLIFLLTLTWEKDEKSCFVTNLIVFHCFFVFWLCFMMIVFPIWTSSFWVLLLFFCFLFSVFFHVTPSPIDPLFGSAFQ